MEKKNVKGDYVEWTQSAKGVKRWSLIHCDPYDYGRLKRLLYENTALEEEYQQYDVEKNE